MKIFEFVVVCELPDKNVFVLDIPKTSAEEMQAVLGNFCSTTQIPASTYRLWCEVVNRYDYNEVLRYLKALAEIPCPIHPIERKD